MVSSALTQWGCYSLTGLTADTTPSLLLCFDSTRYLFNAGEGTTRALVSHGAGFKKIAAVFSTRADAATSGGLAGAWFNGETDSAVPLSRPCRM
jgi:ribonuclease Z